MGLCFCILAFFSSLFFGMRSLVAGLVTVLWFGFFYGILRANCMDNFSHFIFDSAVIGFYLSLIQRRFANKEIRERFRPLTTWLKLLIGWVLIMSLLPIQHFLIQFVGLRGNCFLLPFILIGAWLNGRDAYKLSLWLAVLNVVSLGFAVAEFVVGVPAFYPLSSVTDIIYKSKLDVANHTALRIPATFSNAHSYAFSMVFTLPFLIGASALTRTRTWRFYLLGFGIFAALIGNFLAATRSNLGILFVIVVVTTFSSKLKSGMWFGWFMAILIVIGFVSNEVRMQRFKTLQDPDLIVSRVRVSLKMLSFTDVLMKYPMGNGMGGGGTSVPYFLRHLIKDPVIFENEYSRILLEQGMPGLLLWFAFIAWICTRKLCFQDPWFLGQRLMWFSAITRFGMAIIGTGMMTAIPGTPLFFLQIGFLTMSQPGRAQKIGRDRRYPYGSATNAKHPKLPTTQKIRSSID